MESMTSNVDSLKNIAFVEFIPLANKQTTPRKKVYFSATIKKIKKILIEN